MTKLLEKIQGKNFDLALIDPNLQNQSPLVQDIQRISIYYKEPDQSSK